MRPRLAQLHQSGATHGQVASWDGDLGMWVPISLADVVPTPLFADDGSGPLLDDAGTDYLYPDS